MVDEHDIFPAFAFMSFVLVVIPFPWHLQAWNTGTCLYMFWTAMSSLNTFINSIIWKDNAINWAPVWCDMSSKVYVLVNVAIPTASLCINRRLYHIASVKTVTVTKATKRRAIIVDLSIGLGVPIIQLIFQYFCQGHRFDIYEQIGCFPATYNTPLAFAFVYSWPIVIGLISGVYCCLTIHAFLTRRAQFKELLSANSELSASRYFRLMALAGIEILCTVPLATWGLYVDLTAGIVSPYKGFADTHYNFSHVNQIPALIWMNWGIFADGLRLTRWSTVICGFVFFAFFGFADEARKHYWIAFQTVAKRVGFSTGSMGSSGGLSSGTEKPYPQMGSTTYPSFVQPMPKRESVHSTTSSFRSLDGGDHRRDSSFVDPISGHLTIADIVNMKEKKDDDEEDDVASSASAPSLRSPSNEHVRDTLSACSEPTLTNNDNDRRKSSASSPPAPAPRPLSGVPVGVIDVTSPPRHVADAPIPAGTDDIA